MNRSLAVVLWIAFILSGCSDDGADVCRNDPQRCPPDSALSDGSPVDSHRVDGSVPDSSVMGSEGGTYPDLLLHDTTPAPDSSFDAPSVPYKHEDVSVQTVSQWVTSQKTMTLVDVREPFEFQSGYIAGAINLPWTSGVLKTSLTTLSKAKPVVVYCKSGNRSNSAATYLVGQGYDPVIDMMGGMNAWKTAGLPVKTP